MNAKQLIEKWEASLCHANANYQMIVMEKIAKSFDGCGLSVLQDALSLANPSRKPNFFNRNHRVFEVLIKKGMIKVREDPQELVYSLNLTKPTKEDRRLVKLAARRALRAFEVSQ